MNELSKDSTVGKFPTVQIEGNRKVNSKKEYMGLTSWKHSPEGRILKSDVSIAKNYLTFPKNLCII